MLHALLHPRCRLFCCHLFCLVCPCALNATSRSPPPTPSQGFLSLAPKGAVQRLKSSGGAAPLGAAEYSSPRPEPKGASKGAKGSIPAEGGKAGGIKAGAASITVDCGGAFRLRPTSQ